MSAKTIVLALALGLVACSPSGKAEQESHSASLPEVAVPVTSASPASASPSGISASAAPHPSRAELVKWRTEMDTLCASAAPSLRMAHFDVDGNDTADTICWRILKTKAYGELIDLQARVTNGGKTQTAYIIIPFGGGNQYGICGPSEAIVAEQRRWTKEAFEDMGWDDLGPISISLNGGDCDPPWLFWPKGETGEAVDFIFARA